MRSTTDHIRHENESTELACPKCGKKGLIKYEERWKVRFDIDVVFITATTWQCDCGYWIDHEPAEKTGERSQCSISPPNTQKLRFSRQSMQFGLDGVTNDKDWKESVPVVDGRPLTSPPKISNPRPFTLQI